ncbi:hypothetical protein CCH79_00020155 [Gambusia affinis]|uniref:Uncharacterized protein n=1 Tax=Gambusia affinis TaxID=33528 RepID=A0A315VFF4_GAMAF|nr:hypothetical protein CCH79_00020155 [Gambusia affinis]
MVKHEEAEQRQEVTSCTSWTRLLDESGSYFGSAQPEAESHTARKWLCSFEYGGQEHDGDSRCFLFSVFPTLRVYTATGYNEHFMYLNQHQQTMPNGLVRLGPVERNRFTLQHRCDLTDRKSQQQLKTTGLHEHLKLLEELHSDV